MKKIGSEIHRLFIVHTLVFLVLAAGVAQLYGFVVEDNVLNNQLRAEADYLGQTLSTTGIMPSPRYPFMQLIDGWPSLHTSIQTARLDSPHRIEFKTIEGKNIHIVPISPCEEHCLLVAYVDDFTIADQTWFFSAGGMLAIALMIMLVSSFGVFRLLKRITLPISALQNQIQKGVEERGFDKNFIATMPDNEIGFLAETISSYQQNMTVVLEREKQFTRDISHELRTPITVIQNQIAQWNDIDNDEIRLSQSQLNKTTKILDVLTALARSQSQYFTKVSVLKTIEDVTLAMSMGDMPEDFQLKLDVPASFSFYCNQHLFELLVRNLIENAFTHGKGKTLSVYAINNTIVFLNQIADIPQQSSIGLGQGSSLVRRIVDFHKGTLVEKVVKKGSDESFEVTITFPLNVQ